jgi:hypothetical protein
LHGPIGTLSTSFLCGPCWRPRSWCSAMMRIILDLLPHRACKGEQEGVSQEGGRDRGAAYHGRRTVPRHWFRLRGPLRRVLVVPPFQTLDLGSSRANLPCEFCGRCPRRSRSSSLSRPRSPSTRGSARGVEKGLAVEPDRPEQVRDRAAQCQVGLGRLRREPVRQRAEGSPHAIRLRSQGQQGRQEEGRCSDPRRDPHLRFWHTDEEPPHRAVLTTELARRCRVAQLL